MPKMDILNLFFGAVTILSFGYALWANRTLYNLQSPDRNSFSNIFRSSARILTRKK